MLEAPGYEFKEKIYSGLHYDIYRSLRITDHKSFILKLPRTKHPSEREIANLQHEYYLLTRFSLPGVVHAYELILSSLRPVLVLEDLKGESLDTFLGRNALDLNKFFDLSSQILKIIRTLHKQRIIHKDIKPANIIINAANKVKLIDLSLSTELSEESQEIINPNLLEGTLAYLSPEQTGRINRPVDYRTDFYSLGLTFFEMLTGELPFQANDPLELIHCHLAKQPPLATEINPNIPMMLALIINKLLAKMPEDRYSSSDGLQADLDECAHQWQQKGHVDSFTLGLRDIDDHLSVSHKLYGRENDVNQLLTAFDRVSEGSCEIMLVSGYAGIGKTSLVKEIHKPITEQKGYFLSGKFDQLKRNKPFSAFVEAFQGMVKQLLAEPDNRLNYFREALVKALGNVAQVIIDVIPEVEFIIGKQPAVPIIEPTEAYNRFKLAFQDFVKVFTSANSPLVIFLDDLQWADPSSLQMIESLLTNPSIHNLLIIGAYRSNEVGPDHLLTLTEQALLKAAVPIERIDLLPLNINDVEQLLADTLNQSREAVSQLAALIMEKTQGNPFFIGEFIQILYHEKLLTFSREHARWQWDIAHIRNKDMTANVIDLLASKIKQLSPAAQQTLKLAACIRHTFDLQSLSIISEQPFATIAQHALQAMYLNLILPIGESYRLTESYASENSQKPTSKILYRFSHDRIQQAAYQLIPDNERQIIHLTIARLMIRFEALHPQSEQLFDVLNQFNQGLPLITDETEKIQIAEANLWGGQKAKTSTAYLIAIDYLTAGIHLLPDDAWQSQYELIFNFYKELAECQYLTGDFHHAEENFKELLVRAKNIYDKAEIVRLLMAMYSTQNRFTEAVELGVQGLNELGFPIRSTPNKFQALFSLLKTQWKTRNADSAHFQIQPMTDRRLILVVKLSAQLTNIAFFVNQNLLVDVTAKVTDMSLKQGYTQEIPYCYSVYAFVLLHGLKKFDQCFAFVDIAMNLTKHFHESTAIDRSIYVVGGHLAHWKYPLKDGLDKLLKAFREMQAGGDLVYSFYAATLYTSTTFAMGKPLEEMSKAYELLESFVKRAKVSEFPDLVHFLRDSIVCLKTGEYDLAAFLKIIPKRDNKTEIAMLLCHFTKVAYLTNHFELAVLAGEENEKLADYTSGLLCHAEGKIYYALGLAARYQSVSAREQRQYFKQLKSLAKEVKRWAIWCPDNFLQYDLLITAEIMAIRGDVVSAMQCYDKAILAAEKNICLHLLGAAHERAAVFYNKMKLPFIAAHYLLNAHYAYKRWGALAKCSLLEIEYPNAFTAVGQTTDIDGSSSTQALDLFAILKSSQAIADIIHLDKLLEKLLKVVLEEAGAQRAVLISKRGKEWVIEAERTVDLQHIYLTQPVSITENAELPHALIQYVQHTHELVVKPMDNQPLNASWDFDPYLDKAKPASWLLLPILYQGKLKNIIYIENKTTANVFTSRHLQSLKLLSTQAAISLENAKLYYQVTHDPLTGLANRNLLHNYFLQCLSKKDYKKHIAILYGDLDDFKKINDTLGHAIGDMVLQYFADHIQAAIGENDLAVRLSGDEFVILLGEKADVARIEAVIASIYKDLSKPAIIQGHEIFISFSMGVSLYPIDGKNLNALLKKADTALYSVKKTDRNNYQFYHH